MDKITLQAGSPVFYDSLTAGLVPCRIVTIDQYQHAGTRLLLTVTGARGCYSRGQQIDCPAWFVLPRKLRRVRGTYGQRVIVPPVEYIATRGAL